MPTHDYIISNGTGAAVRADINSALSAIVSLNSSASEPATMYAYQLWADTALQLLKIRNSANSAWITLRQLDGDFSIVAVEDGLLASPSLTFTNDLNTGIFRPGNDSLAIVTGGTRKLLIDANGGLTIDLGDAEIYGVRVGRGGSAVSSNTAVGSLALNANTIGAFNTAVGKNALTLNVGGIDNTAMGSSALGGNTSGTGNTAIGLQSLFTNSTANFNTALGLGALFTNNAANNTAVGVAALKFNSSGANNTALGTIALENSTLGSNNICIGYNSGNSLTTGSNNTIIGSIAGTAGLADTVIIGAGTAERLRIDSSGRLLVGTSTARDKLFNGTTSANIPQFQSEKAGGGLVNRLLVTGNNGTVPANSASELILARSYGTTLNSYTAVTSADSHLGAISFQGADGTEFVEAASINCFTDAACGADDMPGRLVFSTTADGSASPTERMRISANGNVNVVGALSKGSGSFRIDHPLSEKKDTHHLIHSFIEGPQADLIYRGHVNLINGKAIINIDEAARMAEGTFNALCTNVCCFTSNESDWTAVRGSVSDNILTIEAQDLTSTAEVCWMVIGERKDKHMLDTNWTDENGRVITEPLKEVTPSVTQ